MTAASALELPPPRREPLDKAAAPGASGPERRRRFLLDLLGDRDLYLALPSRTAVDVGSWLGRRRVAVYALGDGLVLAAWGPRPYVERVPYEALRESLYNHVTGELVLGPAPETCVRRLRMSPLDGYQVLAQIYCEE
jgi:hypothetical protein